MWYGGINTEGTNSQIGYATSDNGITWVKADSVNPVLTTGSSGQWDDAFVYCGGGSVLFINNLYHMWYTGSQDLDVTRKVGWATSDDGIHWNKYNNPATTSMLESECDPVLEPSMPEWDGTYVEVDCLIPEGDSLRMWYSGALEPTPTNLWRIGHASLTLLILDSLIALDLEPSEFVGIPNNFILKQNYPNPFNPKTTINYQLPITSYVEISIYNLLAQKLTTLVDKKQNAGYHQVEWDASAFASGVYYYQLRTEAGFIQTKKLVLMK